MQASGFFTYNDVIAIRAFPGDFGEYNTDPPTLQMAGGSMR